VIDLHPGRDEGTVESSTGAGNPERQVASEKRGRCTRLSKKMVLGGEEAEK